jgi:hypothetical protein
MITALAAGIVSLSALTVSIYEAYLMREQQAASVLPIIDFWAAYSTDHSYSLNLANKGLGPAFVKHISVSVDDTPTRSWVEVVRELTGRQIPLSESALIGSVLAPGEAGAMVAVNHEDNGTLIWRNAGRVVLGVCYCSVFGNCWTTTIENLNTGKPTTVETAACPTEEDIIF